MNILLKNHSQKDNLNQYYLKCLKLYNCFQNKQRYFLYKKSNFYIISTLNYYKYWKNDNAK